MAKRSASRADSTTTTSTSTVRFEGSSATYDARYYDDSDEGDNENMDEKYVKDDGKRWLDLDTRISTPDSDLLISPPRSPSLSTLRPQSSTRGSGDEEDQSRGYPARLSPSYLSEQPRRSRPGHTWSPRTRQPREYYNEPSPTYSDSESRSPSDETIRRQGHGKGRKKQPDVEVQAAGRGHFTDYDHGKRKKQPDVEVQAAASGDFIDYDHGKGKEKKREKGSDVKAQATARGDFIDYDHDDGPALMNMIMDGIGRMSVTMRMDEAGRWRIVRQRSEESFVAENFL